MAATHFACLCLCLCTLAMHIHTARSIHCWECNSHYDRNCADPFQNETFALTDCDQRDLEHLPQQKATVCRKIVQKVRDDYRFVRGCGWLSNEKEGSECFKRAGTFNVLIQFCSCGGDGCNAAPTPEPTPLARWLFAAAAFTLLALK